MYYNLNEKVILITGAAGGIGAAAARALYKAGANLVLTDITRQSVNRLAREFEVKRVLPQKLDVTDYESALEIVKRSIQKFGKLDILIANAGISWRRSASTISSCDEHEFERIIEVDLLGVWRTVKAALPEIERNKGQILVTASIYSFMNGMINAPYAVSKAGIESLARSLRAELAGKGATASVLYPGWTATPIADVGFGGDNLVTSMLKLGYPSFLRHPIKPEVVAQKLVNGLCKRKPRIIVPARWAPFSVFRGVFNMFTDWSLNRNTRMQKIIRQLEENHK